MTKPKKDLRGMKFGMLTVLSQADDYITKDGKHRTKWHCQCECGNCVDVIGDNLKKGNTQSCGCTRAESLRKHGGRRTRLYTIWSNMKTRCYDVGNRTYQEYGARGISICDEWKNDFAAFRDWALENGYDDQLTIDRIDNGGNYCPENCRWADAKTQANNRRSSKYVTVDGATRSLAEWSDEIGYSRSIFHARAKLYKTTIEEQVAILVRAYNEKTA